MTQYHIGAHIHEEVLEEYAFGRLSEDQCAPVEEHLLVCRECQERLGDVDEYIALFRAAAAEGPREKDKTRHPVWYFAGGAIAAGLAFAGWFGMMRIWPVRNAPESVELASVRGTEHGHIQANRPADLIIAVPDLPDAGYRIDVVDGNGRKIWSGEATAAAGRVRVMEPRRLPAGIYWVRLYSSSGELLREFGLESS